MGKDKQKKETCDDNRVIANMNVDGMPQRLFEKRPHRTAFDEFGKTEEKKEPIQLTPMERRSVIKGIVVSYLLFGLIVIGAFAILIYFLIKFWLRR